MEIFLSLLIGLEFFTATATATPTNVAIGKPVLVSRLDPYTERAWSVDGIKDTRYCTYISTTKHHQNWLLVDLKGTFTLKYVTITTDNYDRGPLNSFAVLLLDNNPVGCIVNFDKVCINLTQIVIEGPRTSSFSCQTPIIGRFLFIYKWRVTYTNDVLRICEVEAFVDPTDICQHPRTFPRVTGRRLAIDDSEDDAGSVPVSDILECSYKCSTNGSCLAFNYKKHAKMCELICSPEKHMVIRDTNWDYYGHDFCY